MLRSLVAAAVCSATAIGCGEDRPPAAGLTRGPIEPDASAYFDIDDPVPKPPDAGCGGVVVPIVQDRPNFYFLVDASGSMGTRLAEPLPGVSTLYLATRAAIRELLLSVGHRVQYGAAVFPGVEPTIERPCPPGLELFETQPGDPVGYAATGQEGPVLTSLMRVLGARVPQGTTPTGKTLRALTPTLTGLPGETFLFLLTDGAPNCDEDAVCGPTECEPNLVGDCPPDINCCESSPMAPLAHLGCIDAQGTRDAIRELASAGIKTFVIGLPGTQAFSSLLDELALAGQTGRDRSPYYYPVDQAARLSEVLGSLGASVAIECTVDLDEAPEAPERVNVYFDQTLVPQNDSDGWRWITESRLEVVGPACDHLKSGRVLQVQVDVGCPTVIR